MFAPGDRLWPVIVQAPERVILSLSYLLLLPMIAAQVQSVTFVPKALADHVATIAPIARFDLPGPPVPLELCQIWSPLLDADSGHPWFRTLLDEAMAERSRRLT